MRPIAAACGTRRNNTERGRGGLRREDGGREQETTWRSLPSNHAMSTTRACRSLNDWAEICERNHLRTKDIILRTSWSLQTSATGNRVFVWGFWRGKKDIKKRQFWSIFWQSWCDGARDARCAMSARVRQLAPGQKHFPDVPPFN